MKLYPTAIKRLQKPAIKVYRQWMKNTATLEMRIIFQSFDKKIGYSTILTTNLYMKLRGRNGKNIMS